MHFPGKDQSVKIALGSADAFDDCFIRNASPWISRQTNKIKSRFIDFFKRRFSRGSSDLNLASFFHHVSRSIDRFQIDPNGTAAQFSQRFKRIFTLALIRQSRNFRVQYVNTVQQYQIGTKRGRNLCICNLADP